jgi:hypothetical protein
MDELEQRVVIKLPWRPERRRKAIRGHSGDRFGPLAKSLPTMKRRVRRLIHEMEDREMCAESDDEREAKSRAMEAHNKKDVAFLMHIQKLLNDSIPG